MQQYWKIRGSTCGRTIGGRRGLITAGFAAWLQGIFERPLIPAATPSPYNQGAEALLGASLSLKLLVVAACASQISGFMYTHNPTLRRPLQTVTYSKILLTD